MKAEGTYSACDLAQLTPLFMPWQERDGSLCPPFGAPALRLSYALAVTAYDLDMQPWREAGWYDFSYLVDNTLLSGAALNAKGTFGAISAYYQHLAHARIVRDNPISQLRGVLRQKETSDTCKAIVMMHGMPDGRYLVAIGFMGTGKRIYDWISNFRMEEEEGAHRGFLQLTREFEENLDKIQFPRAAKELGLEHLTLLNILERCKKPGSPFHIWMAGHSQGGAVMQLFAYRQIQKGFLRQNLIGYGFAAPSAVYGPLTLDVAGVPLYHIISTDDLVPRIGAAYHIGRCMIYAPDDRMRSACYGNAEESPLFRAMCLHLSSIRDSRGTLLWLITFMTVLDEMPENEVAAVVGTLGGKLLFEKMMGLFGGQMDKLIRAAEKHLEKTYLSIYNEAKIPWGMVQMQRQHIEALIEMEGISAFLKTFLAALSLPHQLKTKKEDRVSAYSYIVNEGCERLHERVWHPCAPYQAVHRNINRRRVFTRTSNRYSQRRTG